MTTPARNYLIALGLAVTSPLWLTLLAIGAVLLLAYIVFVLIASAILSP